MDKPQIQTLKPTTTSRQKTLILNALHKSSPHRRRSRRRVPTTRIAEKFHRNDAVYASEEADEKEAVECKIRALQSIVPGGESLGVDKLFEQTAEYIMNLQHQVKAMRALSSFFESLEKEKSKCGVAPSFSLLVGSRISNLFPVYDHHHHLLHLLYYLLVNLCSFLMDSKSKSTWIVITDWGESSTMCLCCSFINRFPVHLSKIMD
ncbi:unnamed protein product [Citrullus colocynthis]|uniref:Uncharacterized protein n=1 Tax=Citrullus colocynthis TaxID=252529 RepID=A0ABP0XK80_9ROSI